MGVTSFTGRVQPPQPPPLCRYKKPKSQSPTPRQTKPVTYGTDSREANCLIAEPAFVLLMRRRKHELASLDEGHRSHCYLHCLSKFSLLKANARRSLRPNSEVPACIVNKVFVPLNDRTDPRPWPLWELPKWRPSMKMNTWMELRRHHGPSYTGWDPGLRPPWSMIEEVKTEKAGEVRSPTCALANLGKSIAREKISGASTP